MKKLYTTIILLIIYGSTANAQWVLSNTGLSNPGVFSFLINGANTFVGTNVGIDLSTNNAATWSSSLGGTYPALTLASDGTNIFAGTQSGGAYLSVNNGSTWTPVDSGLTSNEIYSIAISGTNVFAGTLGGGVFLSTNNGTFWTAVNTGLTNLNVLSVAINGTNIFAGTMGGGVFLSTNNGASWAAINTGIPSGADIRAFLFSGTNIFAASNSGIYLSTNVGSTWATTNTGLTTVNVYSLALAGSAILAGTDGGGVFLSNNNGANWTTFNTGFPSFGIAFALAVNTTTIFVAMYSDGVYTRQLSQINDVTEINNQQSIITIYPNPATSQLTITSEAEKIKGVKVYTILGSEVLTNPQGFKNLAGLITIDISKETQGIYFVEIKTEQGIIYKKIIKE